MGVIGIFLGATTRESFITLFESKQFAKFQIMRKDKYDQRDSNCRKNKNKARIFNFYSTLFFFFKFLVDTCPFCEATDTPVMDFW